MTDLPVWLLDIDGVVNAGYRGDPPIDVWPEWIATSAHNERVWPINAAVPVLDFIRRVHDEHHAEIRWHTTWQEKAANVGSALGLPDFPVHPAPEFDGGMRSFEWWKLPGVWRVLDDEGRRLVWTDDDIGTELRFAERAALETRPEVLMVTPPSSTGLRPQDLERIAEFLGMKGESDG